MAHVTIRIPTPFRSLTGGRDEVDAAGGCVADIIEDLDRRHPGIKDRIYDDRGELRRFVNVYLNDEDIRFQEGLRSPVRPGDRLAIVPAIAGGGFAV